MQEAQRSWSGCSGARMPRDLRDGAPAVAEVRFPPHSRNPESSSDHKIDNSVREDRPPPPEPPGRGRCSTNGARKCGARRRGGRILGNVPVPANGDNCPRPGAPGSRGASAPLRSRPAPARCRFRSTQFLPFSGTLLQPHYRQPPGVSPRFAEPPASPRVPRYRAQQPQGGDAVRPILPVGRKIRFPEPARAVASS